MSVLGKLRKLLGSHTLLCITAIHRLVLDSIGTLGLQQLSIL